MLTFPGLRLFNIFRLIFLTIVTFFLTVHVSPAQPKVFTPADADVVLLKTLFSKFERQYRQDIASLPQGNKKELEELYKLRWGNIKEKFDDKEIFTSETAQQNLDKLISEIVDANPLLQKQQFNCYFSRSGVPNASYLGEGVILFNMGLFERLENESQAIFILCHEISHFILKHSENSIEDYVNTVNSKEIQQELHKIKSREYNKRQDLENLVKSLTFSTRRHSRNHESQADSMAIELMRNTSFNLYESLTTLALLDSIDTETFNTESCLEQIFDFKDYPFKDKWIAKEEGLLGGHAQLKEDSTISDSLKTHPACKTRIKLLENPIRKFTSESKLKDVVDKTTFVKLKKDFGYEMIEYSFVTGNYTRSLYYTLRMIQHNSSDPYLVTQVGKIFNGLYTAQKNHTVSKISSLPSPWFPANYNLLLQFIQNLYREDIASISYHFLKQYRTQLDDYLPFKNEYNTSIQIAQQ